MGLILARAVSTAQPPHIIIAAMVGTTVFSGLFIIRTTLVKAGAFAASIFAIGIIAAGVSSQLPNVLMLPWLLNDYAATPKPMTLTRYRIVVFLISLLGLVVPIFEARPLFVMVLSQTFNAFILPATVLCIFYLSNKTALMGQYKNTLVSNVVLSLILVFSLFTSWLSVEGLFITLGISD